MKKDNFSKIINSLDFQKHKLININENLQLTNYQFQIIKNYGINPNNYRSIKDLIHDLTYLVDNDDDQLDDILMQLSERNYYENINK